MKPMTVEDVSEILDTFSLSEISDLLKKQVELKDNDAGLITTDYFHPIYLKYRSIMESEETSGDIKDEATERFNDVCDIFINLICEKFNLAIDQDWKEEHKTQLPGLVTSLYHFFIRDLSTNLQEVCINYINQNRKTIFEVFEERKNKKDASTLVNKRNFPVDLAVILANIYDTSTWAIRQLSEEEYIRYMNNDYAPLKVIQSLMEESIISGEFMDVIEEVYEDCVGLKGQVCFNILSSFKVNNGKEE